LRLLTKVPARAAGNSHPPSGPRCHSSDKELGMPLLLLVLQIKNALCQELWVTIRHRRTASSRCVDGSHRFVWPLRAETCFGRRERSSMSVSERALQICTSVCCVFKHSHHAVRSAEAASVAGRGDWVSQAASRNKAADRAARSALPRPRLMLPHSIDVRTRFCGAVCTHLVAQRAVCFKCRRTLSRQSAVPCEVQAAEGIIFR